MDMMQLAAIVVSCIVSAGSIGGIVFTVIKFSSNIIADRLSAKYEYRLKKLWRGIKSS